MPRPFGYKVTEKTKKKISETRKKLGLKPIPYERNKNVEIKCIICGKVFEVVYSRKEKAKFCSNNCRAENMKCCVPWNKGKFISSKYGACHNKIRKIKGTPSFCDICGTSKAKVFEWANMTGDFNNIEDYKRMCRSCHSKHDNKIKNITKCRNL